VTPGPREATPAILVVIPARGGSKGIPRKNLRPLGGRPLIGHAIETALSSSHAPEVWVTSEDPEILAISAKLGARTHARDPRLAADETTLDGVVHDAYQAASAGRSAAFDLVVTLQPTSPLLTTASLDAAIGLLLEDPDVDTVISATDATHLTWRRVDGEFLPNYERRLNRQQLPPTYRETGGFLITRPRFVTDSSRIGPRVRLHLLEGPEAIDIDTPEDFNLCAWYLARRKVLFVVSGYSEIGLGHVANSLIIASELVRHAVSFLVDRRSELAHEVLRRANYPVHRQQSDDLTEDVARLTPDVVINDRLDTSEDYVLALKRRGLTVINFEDLGAGARHADLVINAIYPEQESLPNHYFGQAYFCARPEFLMTEPAPVREMVRRVLITFGGTDPNDLTRRALDAIGEECRARGIEIDVILGTGYQRADPQGAAAGNVRVMRSVSDMSEHMRAADIVITSAGRTVFEVACIGTPAIVLAQNERELTHLFATEEHGFLNLGLGSKVSPASIRSTLTRLIDDRALRTTMQRRMLDNDLRTGKARVMGLIHRTIEPR
jgi:CMP-N-acetylneuraminic acid synthetase/spore coat polysaccharide biosynthesis predicted glycosyltransferase SpsG